MNNLKKGELYMDKNKIFKLFIAFCLIFSVFVVPVNASELQNDVKYESKENHIMNLLEEFYFEGVHIEFYDEKGNVLNETILQMRNEYLIKRQDTLKIICNMIDSTLKVEDTNMNTREAVLPDIGGGSSYRTKKLSKTVYVSDISNDYANYTFTFTGRIRLGKYVEWIDPNVTSPVISKSINPKYKNENYNFLVDFWNYVPCYGNYEYGCSLYAYVIEYKISLYIPSVGTLKNNRSEHAHANIYARDYQWFNTADEFYNW